MPPAIEPASTKRKLEAGPGQDDQADEDIEAKRRRVLEETRDIDADSEGSKSESSDEERWVTLTLTLEVNPRSPELSSDEEDETAELLRELEKIKRERAEQRAQEVSCITVQVTSSFYSRHEPGT